MTEQTTPQTEESTNTAPTLTINDLLVALQVIQIATQRGTLKPEELITVGTLYDRLVKFLEASGALKKAETSDQTAKQTAEEAESADSPAPAKKAAAKAKK